MGNPAPSFAMGNPGATGPRPVARRLTAMTTTAPPPAAEKPVDPAVRGALSQVFDPCCRDKGISVVDMGLLDGAVVEDGTARVELVLTSGWCPFASGLLSEITAAVEALEGVERADVRLVWDRVWGPERLSATARDRLRFLPHPAQVPDPARYVQEKQQNQPGGDR